MDVSKAVTGIAAAATIISLLVSHDFRDVVSRSIVLPAWTILIILGVGVTIGWIARRGHFGTRRRPHVASDILINLDAKYVAATKKDSPDEVGAAALSSKRGTFSTWVYLHHVGQGIRLLENNRYVLACTDHPQPKYRSVVAVSRGPLEFSPPNQPAWKVWLVNDDGTYKEWTYPDGAEFVPGWHLITFRWNHDLPRIELLIGKKVIISETDYQSYWPRTLPDRAMVGCWPNGNDYHFLNTFVWRTQLLSVAVSDSWIAEEMSRPLPPIDDRLQIRTA